MIDAESETDAINKISRTGYFPLSVSREDADLAGAAPVRRGELAVFTRELANLIGAGITVLSALALIHKETGNRHFKRVLCEVIDEIKGGKTFSESLARHPRMFNDIYCAMIRTGEASGNLKEILRSLSGFMEREEEFKESVLSALIYPLFVVAVGFITVVILLVFVVPGLVSMFSDMGQALPLPTRLLIGLSSFAVHYGLACALALIAAAAGIRSLLTRPKGRLLFDRSMLKAGVLGEILFKTETSRLLKNLALLLSSGMLITVALERAAATSSNMFLRQKLTSIIQRIREGTRFSHALKSLEVFPESMLTIIAVGEETGSLDEALRHIAAEYESEVNRALKVFTRVLEPAVILLIGAVVAFIIIAMLLPVFEINFLVR
ncbi:MAG: type II secretion system F family protein [Deltaproteobacteria bacterium]